MARRHGERRGLNRAAGISAAWLVAALLSGCEPIPAGNPLEPVAVKAPRASAPAPVADPQATDAPATDGGFDFAGEDRSEDEARRDLDRVELQARLLGVDPALLRAPGEAPPRVAPPPVAPVEAAPPAPQEIPVWDPAEPLPDGSFGVRVLATLVDVQPPRAILGLTDGSERVVQAGAILEDHKLVVMAIGRDVVQLARVVPQGFYARVDTQDVRSLFPSQRAQAAQ